MLLLQWYQDTEDARIFKGPEMIAELPSCLTNKQAERKAVVLGLKKIGKWRRTDWGMEADVGPRAEQ